MFPHPAHQHPDTSPAPAAPLRPHVDVVVVGARVAGAATALLLARSGLRVLVVDKSAYGSDTFSSHALMRGAVNQLDRWGVSPELRRQAPAINRTVFRYGDETVEVDVTQDGRADPLMAPRRTLLDRILVDAAAEAGAELRFGTTLAGVERSAAGRVEAVRLADRSGRMTTVGTGLLVGADGLRSAVARHLDIPVIRQGRHASAFAFRYLAGCDVPDDAYQWLWRPGCGGGVIPTDGGLVGVFVGVPPGRFRRELRGDVEAGYHRVLGQLDAGLADAVRAATPVGPIRSWPGVPGQFRQASGPNWALVGDAGYFKDPYAAHGISDALRDAELLAGAIVEGRLDRYGPTRDRLSAPLFEVLEEIASYRWTLDTLPALHLRLSKAMSGELAALAAIRGDAAAAAA